MPLMFIFVVLLAGVGVALIRRRLNAAPARGTGHDDTPARLLGWAVGLLAAEREQWGQAMIGELDHLDGRARRWGFAVGCVGGALVLPPWGRAAASLGTLIAVAAGGAGMAAYTHIHYGLGIDAGTWVGVAIVLVFLVGYILAGSALLRRPGVAGPGLVGGLFVAAAWVAVSGVTFANYVAPLTFPGGVPLLVIVVPAVLGVGATWWGGSAAVGRRAARLAAVSASLGVYLYGVLAVAVVGAAGDPHDNGWTDANVVGDRLGNEFIFSLVLLPLVTATVGWAAAVVTARLRGTGPVPALPGPVPPAPGPAPASGPGPASMAAHRTTRRRSHPAAQEDDHPLSAGQHPGDGPPGTATRRRRIGYLLLLFVLLAVTVFLSVVAWLRP